MTTVTNINCVTYLNNFDIQLMVSDKSSDCTWLRCFTFSVDIYRAKQWAMRVMLVLSSLQTIWPTAVQASTTCKPLCMSVFLYECNVLGTLPVIVSNELCVVKSWTESGTHSAQWSLVILVSSCTWWKMQSASVDNSCLKTQSDDIIGV